MWNFGSLITFAQKQKLKQQKKMAQRSSNFLEYEKKHNRFLRELRSKENQNIVNLVIENNCTILCPHDQSVEQTLKALAAPPQPLLSASNAPPASAQSQQSSSRLSSSVPVLSYLTGNFSGGSSSSSQPASASSATTPTGSASSASAPVAVPLVFVQTHVVYTNSLQFLSLNGVRGTFSDKFDKITVLAGPPTGDDCMAFFSEPLSFFTKGYVHTFWKNTF